MTGKFSAYLSVYNDWDILESALRSIAQYVDELVVVDGAYEWMAPYVHATGCDPHRSSERVYEAIESAGIPFRVVSGVWKNEIEKRTAGYSACGNRYIYRVDADEIYFFDNNVLDEFLGSGRVAALMEVPLYCAPGWVIAQNTADPIGRAGFLFDSQKVSAAQHLHYLWLVLTADRRRTVDAPAPFLRPIAINAHLSNWRTPETSVNRAAFYVLNYFREHGVNWFGDLAGAPLRDLAPFFQRVAPNVFLEILHGNPIVMGVDSLRGRVLRRSPLSGAEEQKFSSFFDGLLSGLARANRDLSRNGRHVFGKTHIDLSSSAAVGALTQDGTIAFRFNSKIRSAKLALRYVIPGEPWEVLREIDPRLDGDTISVDLLNAGNAPPSPVWLRRILELEAWCEDASPLSRIECLRD